MLLVVGLVAFLQSRTDTGPAPTRVAEPQVQAPAPAPAEQLKKGGKLEPEARKVAVRFLQTAVGRTELDEAWALATPELRSGVTLKEWRTGSLPIPPFPVQDLETTGFRRAGVVQEQGAAPGAARTEAGYRLRPDEVRHDDRARLGDGALEGQLLHPVRPAGQIRGAGVSRVRRSGLVPPRMGVIVRRR